MEEIKIEKNIPISGKRQNFGVNYPFDKMETGDSFFIVIKDKEKGKNLRASLHSCARSYSLRNNLNWKFKTAFEKDGIRIWRIK